MKSRKRFCHSSQIRSRHVYHLCSAGHALRDLLQPAPRDQTTNVLTVGGKYRCKSRVGRLERERKRELESSTVPSRSSPGETDDTGNFESTSWQQLSSLVHLVSITRRAKLHRRALIVLHYMLQVCCFPLCCSILRCLAIPLSLPAQRPALQFSSRNRIIITPIQAASLDCIIAHHETIALTHALADWRTDTAKKESTEKPGTHRRRGRCGRRGRRFSATMTTPPSTTAVERALLTST